MIELKQLEMLAAISRQGTISGAARELGYSQPAISQHVNTVERLLETPVLIRSRSGVQLTAAGRVLVDAATPMLTQMERALSEVAAIAGMRSGKVRVACFPSAAAALLPYAFADVRAAHPGLSFVLAEREPLAALEMLRRGQCDIAIVFDYRISSTAEDRLEYQPDEKAFTLMEEDVYVALPEQHRLATKKWIELSDLEDEEWIAGCPECRQHLVSACAEAGYEPKITFETDDYLAMQGLVGANLGIALLPEIVLSAGRHRYPITLRPSHPFSTRTVQAVTTSALLGVPGIAPTIEALRRVGKTTLAGESAVGNHKGI